MSMNSVNDRLAEAESDLKYDGYTIGFVTENADPEGLGRIKIKIPNLLDTDQGPVPWCLPTRKSPFGQGPGYGVYGSPKVGSPVRVTFQNGDPQYPVYEADEYLKADANPKFKEPDTWGYKDPAGNELFVNMTTGAWEFTHQSGTTLKYNGEGSEDLHVIKDRTIVVGGNETKHIVGDSTTNIDSNENRTTKGSLNFIVEGDATIEVQGSLTATIGGTADIEASGAMNLSGNPINLN